MSESTRIQALRAMLEKNPGDARAYFGLAAEYEKIGAWDEVVVHLTKYLEMTTDQGNAWGRLGRALKEAGREAESRAAYEQGIAAARAHGHPSMAMEFEEILGQE